MELNSSLFSSETPLLNGAKSVPLLTFPIEKQIMSNWCWAAITASVCRYYNGPNLNQKQIVAIITGKAICATSPPIPFCNETADIGVAFKSVNHLETPINSSLSPTDIVKFLTNGQVIGCQIYLPALGGGHAVIIYGAFADSNDRLILRVADPADSTLLIMPYQQFRTNYKNSGGQWIRSYITQ